METLKESISQTRKDLEDVKEAYQEYKKQHNGDRDHLKARAEKAKKEATSVKERVKALEAEAVVLKESSTKDKAIKVVEDRVAALKVEVK